jgi:hypothetical protein
MQKTVPFHGGAGISAKAETNLVEFGPIVQIPLVLL